MLNEQEPEPEDAEAAADNVADLPESVAAVGFRTAEQLLSHANFPQIAKLAVHADITLLVNMVNKVFQSDDNDPEVTSDMIESVCESLTRSYLGDVVKWGGRAAKILSYLKDLPDEITADHPSELQLKDHLFEATFGDMASVYKYAEDYARNSIRNIRTRFPDNHLVGAFRIFKPGMYKDADFDPEPFIKILMQHYAPSTVDPEDHFVDEMEFKAQFTIVMNMIKSMGDISTTECCEKLLAKCNNTNLGEVLKLVMVWLVFCDQNAVCERGFSVLSRLKDCGKSEMHLKTTDQRMRGNMSAPSFEDEPEAVQALAERTYVEWKGMKKRCAQQSRRGERPWRQKKHRTAREELEAAHLESTVTSGANRDRGHAALDLCSVMVGLEAQLDPSHYETAVLSKLTSAALKNQLMAKYFGAPYNDWYLCKITKVSKVSKEGRSPDEQKADKKRRVCECAFKPAGEYGQYEAELTLRVEDCGTSPARLVQ